MTQNTLEVLTYYVVTTIAEDDTITSMNSKFHSCECFDLSDIKEGLKISTRYQYYDLQLLKFI